MGSDRVQVEKKSLSTLTPGFKPEKSSFLQRRYQDRVEPETDAFTEDKQQNASEQSNPRLPVGHSFGRVSVLPLQAKLAIGQPNDKYEQEADRLASQVVQQINVPSSTQSTQGHSVQRMEEPEEEEEVQRKPRIEAIQRMEELEEEELQTKQIISPIQRSLLSPVIQRLNQPKGRELPTKPIISVLQQSLISPVVQREDLPEEEDLQAKSIIQGREALAGREVSTDLDTAINSARGGGQSLKPGLQESMGQAMGADFSRVRIHTDTKSDQLNHSIQAKAFTTGQDVFFRQGAYQPRSRSGQELIAHELTHVVQQSGEGVRAAQNIQRQPEGSEATDASPGPVATGTGDVSVYVGKTMTSEAALRQIYRKGAREISEEALRMAAQGTSVEDVARWAHQARNDLKVVIRARGSPIIRGLAEARNIRKYGNKIGPTYEELIRQGKTPEDIIGSAGKSNTKVNRAATKLKVGGRFFIGVDLAIVTWEVISAPEGERLRTAVAGGAGVAGAAGGGWAGAKAGAAIGSIFGPIGTAAGGIIGGIGGALVGGWLGRKTAEKAYDLVEDLVNPPSGSLWNLQVIVIDQIEEDYIRTRARQRP